MGLVFDNFTICRMEGEDAKNETTALTTDHVDNQDGDNNEGEVKTNDEMETEESNTAYEDGENSDSITFTDADESVLDFPLSDLGLKFNEDNNLSDIRYQIEVELGISDETANCTEKGSSVEVGISDETVNCTEKESSVEFGISDEIITFTEGEPSGGTNASDVNNQSEVSQRVLSLSEIPRRKGRGRGSMQCDECESKFLSSGSLSRHVRTVHGVVSDLFECKFCGKKFARKDVMIIHEQNSCNKGERRKDDEYVQCSFCDYKIPRRNLGNLKSHIKFYHDKIYDHVCDLCGYKAIKGSILKQHMLSVHENKKYPCETCGKVFTSPGAVIKHDQTFHNINYVFCDLCDFSTVNKTRMKHHKNTKHMGISYKCEQCESEYTHAGSLKEHILIKHKGVKFPCDSCSVICSSVSALNLHRKTIHFNIRLNCPHCETTHATKTNLKIHIQSKHENVKYDCNECDAQLASINSLNQHIENKHSEKTISYKCNLCENEYSNKGGLKQHVLTKHEGVKYPCSQCSFQGSQPSTLIVHA